MFADLLDPSLALQPRQPAAQTLAALVPPVPGTIRKANEVPMNMIGPAAPSAGGTGGVTAAQVRQDNAAGAANIAKREAGTFAPGGFATALGRTFQEEGGFNARDANGAPVNFGINQAAHPEVDVSKLTRDQAAAIYKKDYWDKIGGDALAQQNPALAHVAFDMAVVSNPERALEMIKQSGGDPVKFMDLRALYLEGLVRNHPEIYGKYAQTWRNRDQHLREDIGAGGAAPKIQKPDPGFKMEIAEGPATTMTDASSAPVQASDAAALEPPPEVRAALGLPPITPRNVDSPEQIIPPEVRKALGLPDEALGGNPYKVDLDKKVADDADAKITGTNPETGEPIYADPEVEKRFLAGKTVPVKGVLAGAARDVTGPASVLPNALGGGYAQEATNALNQIGDPLSRGIGGMLPYAIPVGGLWKAGEQALETGAWLAPSVKGALTGLGSGLATGTQGSSKETTEGGRINDKLPAMLEEGFVGSAVGALLPGAAGLWHGSADIAKTITGGYGREASAAAKDLESAAGARVGTAERESDREAKTAAIGGRGERGKLVEHNAELARIEEAQGLVKLREQMRTAEELGHPIDPSQVARLKSQNAKQVLARVFEAEKVAREAGLNAEQARTFAAETERSRLAAEEGVEKLLEDFKARQQMPSSEIGNRLHDVMLKDSQEVKNRLRNESGFAKAVNADGGRPSIDTSNYVGRLERLERRFDVDLGELKSKLRTLPSVEGQPAVARVSIERAREVLETAEARLKGSTSQVRHELEDFKKDFLEHVETIHSGMKTARKKYAELSRPYDMYRDSGVGRKSIANDPYSSDPIIDSTQVARTLFNKSEKSAEALSRLAAKDPSLTEDIKEYFNGVFFPPNRKMTSELFQKLLNDNKDALERVGLGGLKDAETAKRLFTPNASNTIEFRGRSYTGDTNLNAIRAAHRDTGVDMERISNESNDNAARTPPAAKSSGRGPLAEEFEGLKSQLASKEKDVSQAKTAESAASDASKTAEKTSREATGRVSAESNWLKARLSEDAEAPTAAKRAAEANISELATKKAQAETARHALKTLEVDLQGAQSNKEVAAGSGRIIDSLRGRGILNDADYRKLSDQVKDVLKKEHRYEVASKLVHQAIRAAIVGALGGAGFGVEQFVSHRITP